MSEHFNTIVVGLGAMGSAAVYQLAKRGVKVLGIDRLSPPHTFGSTHGDTRITRQAIGEGTHYTPLSLRSYELFREVELQTNTKLLETVGGLIISSEHGSALHGTESFLQTTIDAADKYSIRHEIYDAADIRKKFPQFNVDDDEVAYYEYEAGFLRPEACITAHLDLARSLGAQIHTGETVVGFDETAGTVRVRTTETSYTCDKLILSVGPWIPQMVPELASLFDVQREVLYWFDVADAYASHAPDRMPIYIWQLKDRPCGIYGFPALDGRHGGIKIAGEEYSEGVSPDTVPRHVTPVETAKFYESRIRPFFPGVRSDVIKAVVCLYTNTPDRAFVIDWLPGSERILLCSPCSGHGFKHSAAIGECVASIAQGTPPSVDVTPFNLMRLSATAAG